MAIVMRGPGLGSAVTSSDPQKNGLPPLPVRALNSDSEKTARLVNQFVERSRKVLVAYKPKQPANMILVRGFDSYPDLPVFPTSVWAARSCHCGESDLSRDCQTGWNASAASGRWLWWQMNLQHLEKNWNDFDFFYLHIKNTDIAGEDGDFTRKVNVIEEVDSLMPRLIALKPDVSHCQRGSLDSGCP